MVVVVTAVLVVVVGCPKRDLETPVPGVPPPKEKDDAAVAGAIDVAAALLGVGLGAPNSPARDELVAAGLEPPTPPKEKPVAGAAAVAPVTDCLVVESVASATGGLGNPVPDSSSPAGWLVFTDRPPPTPNGPAVPKGLPNRPLPVPASSVPPPGVPGAEFSSPLPITVALCVSSNNPPRREFLGLLLSIGLLVGIGVLLAVGGGGLEMMFEGGVPIVDVTAASAAGGGERCGTSSVGCTGLLSAGWSVIS